MKIDIKPFSVNKAFQGRRFRTPEYRCFSDELTLKLEPMEIPEGAIQLDIIWGMSNMGSDVDNCAKTFIDVFSKFHGFNDNRIHKLTLEKAKVTKGEEFIDFIVLPYLPSDRVVVL